MKRLLFVAAALLLLGCGEGDDDAGGKDAAPKPPAKAELPGGGRTIFANPRKRVVAFYGNPDDEELGTLGIGTPDQAGRRLLKTAGRYATKERPVLPAMELLATVATADAGPDGLHRRRTTHKVIGRYLKAARKVGALLILDIQPGRASFLPEARRLQRWLKEPDVSLALDPEWRVGPDELPGQVIGSTDGAEIMQVGSWLDELTARLDLPQKLLLVHQFTEGMVANRQRLRPLANVALVLNTDGFGTAPLKVAKYREFARLSRFAFNGFKLFYREDTGLMKPRRVLRMRPVPDVVVYE